MSAMKRILEAFGIVRLVWFTHPWRKSAPQIVLRVVRYQGPRKQPWCWSAGGWRALLLPDGKCKGKYNCSWEPYNTRSPKPTTEREVPFEKEPPQPASWAN